jgi:hypothetical protein
MVYMCFFVSLFLVCSYVVLRTFSPFIRKLTYDFTFPVYILRFHWDFFYWHWLRLPGLGNNNEKIGLPERLIAGTQFRFRNLFHEKISGNPNFIC